MTTQKLIKITSLLLSAAILLSCNKKEDETTNPATCTDADGYTYKTVVIGSQEWMAENLRTTKYQDGTSIPNVTDTGAWYDLITPAYCWYNNDITNRAKYGALYNGYAVNTGNLCPMGWHLPSDVEWHTLEKFVDPSITNPNVWDWRGVDGGLKLKAIQGWNDNGNGTDNYLFSALSGGLLDSGFQ